MPLPCPPQALLPPDPLCRRRTVNGLLKTAQGVPPSLETTLDAKQDQQLRLAAIKCLVGVLRSMGSWTNKQLNLIQVAAHVRAAAVSASQEKEDGDHLGSDVGDHLDGAGSEVSEAAHFEQRRAYKIELQVGVCTRLKVALDSPDCHQNSALAAVKRE